jgi:hypothetical protein
VEQQRREDQHSLGVSGRAEAVSERGAFSLSVDAVFLLFPFVPFVELVAQVATPSFLTPCSMRQREEGKLSKLRKANDDKE